MAYLISNIPYFKVWVRKEFTHNHNKYEGEFVHGLAIAVTTMPDRCLSFQIIFTGSEVDGTEETNNLGGAMWARMPITALCYDGVEWGEEPPKRWKPILLNRGIVPRIIIRLYRLTDVSHLLGWQN